MHLQGLLCSIRPTESLQIPSALVYQRGAQTVVGKNVVQCLAEFFCVSWIGVKSRLPRHFG
jgi:hypothetical protein